MLFLAWFAYFSFGITANVTAPMVFAIMGDLKLTHAEMGTVFGSWPLFYVTSSLLTGLAIDRFSLRKLMGLGMAVITLSALLRGLATSYPAMFLSVAIFGLGGPTISIGGPKMISIWFKGKERNTATGVYLSGLALGGIIGLASTNGVVIPWVGSWRLALIFFSTIAMGATVLWWLLAREQVKPRSPKTDPEKGIPFRESLDTLFRLRNTWVIIAVGVSNLFMFWGLTNWLPAMIEQKGESQIQAGYLASIPTATGVLGAVLIPKFSPEGKLRYILMIQLAVMSASIYALGASSGLPLIVALSVWGIASGALNPLLMLVLMNTPEIGSKLMGAAGGIYFTLGEIGGFAGPYLVGTLADSTQSFFPSAVLLAVMAASNIPLLLLTREGG